MFDFTPTSRANKTHAKMAASSAVSWPADARETVLRSCPKGVLCVPHYLFNIRDGKDIIDNEGTELSDIAQVRDARFLFRAEANAQQWIEVDDGVGTIIGTPQQGALAIRSPI
jgi:hypothetical protein